jgi:multiple sugar transport system substrate-binding protein
MWGGDEEGFFRQALDAYEKSHPTVRIENLGSVDDTKAIRAIVAGAPPDLITLRDPAILGVMAANGAIQPLDARFRAAGLDEKAFTHGALSQCRYDNRLYAIPYLLDCMALLINDRAFRDAGLDPAHPPRTLEALEDACRRLTRRGPDGRLTRIGLRPFDAVMLLGIYGAPFTDAHGRVTLDDPRHVAATAWYKRLMDAQGGNEAVEAFAQGFANEQGSYNAFYTGSAAMTFNGQWNAYWVSRYRPDCRFTVAPLPYPEALPERAGTVWLGGNLFCIPVGARHADAAWEFLAWSQTPEAQRLFARTIKGIPNLRASLKDPALRTGEAWRADYAHFLDLADSPNAAHFPVLPVASLYLSEITAAVDAVRYGRQSPEAALAAARDRVQRELDKYTAAEAPR